ncbi:myb-like protein X [Teleopsis dalmanni]|uniref:myb-like protein X n=1 Tax=Teleopsis dalmanni TaxID=139649 RepID=UPI0018CCC244|nr:myb-like protein X [Teleopsis dalmanni]
MGKKTRKSVNEKEAKSNFFIKLSPKLESNKDSSPTAKKGSSGKSPAPAKSPKNQKPKSLVKKIGSNEKAQRENSKLTFKPTKFSKTFLEKTYGKRFFQLEVKMEKFEHPILVEFDAKANAAKKEARDKKKNLSVSFKDQVEIFGISDSDSDVEVLTTSAIKEPANKAPQIPVTPAKLIKTENGKVVDTIDLDSTLFLDPKEAVASTPLKLPARKKHDKKSFSPLKDEGLTSPRKEQLKLADEKLPPKDLRCLSTGEVEEDDEDVEYIVPFEVPPRTAAKSGTDTETGDDPKETDSDKQIPNNNENKENENKQNEKTVGEDETSAKKSPEVSVSSEIDSKVESSAESFATAGNDSDNDDASFAKLNNVTGSLSKTCDTAECNENKRINIVEEKDKNADGNEEIKGSNTLKFDKCSNDNDMILRMEDDVSEKHQDTEAYSEDDNKDSEKVSNDDSTETHPPEPDSAADPETDDEELKNSQSKADKQTVSTTTTELVGVTNSNN